MRKIIVVFGAILLNILLFSCTDDTASESELLYETQATEGEDNDSDDNPDN